MILPSSPGESVSFTVVLFAATNPTPPPPPPPAHRTAKNPSTRNGTLQQGSPNEDNIFFFKNNPLIRPLSAERLLPHLVGVKSVKPITGRRGEGLRPSTSKIDVCAREAHSSFKFSFLFFFFFFFFFFEKCSLGFDNPRRTSQWTMRCFAPFQLLFFLRLKPWGYCCCRTNWVDSSEKLGQAILFFVLSSGWLASYSGLVVPASTTTPQAKWLGIVLEL